MPRPRNKKFRDLPEGLYHKGEKGYVFRRIDNTWKSLGKERSRAVALARRYNATYRIDPEITHEVNPSLVSTKRKKGLVPFSQYLKRVIKRYKEEENPSEETYKYFVSRVRRLAEVIGNKPGMVLDLHDVNHVLETLAEGKSNEVYNRWISVMVKVFDYAVDDSVMLENPAKRKKRKPLESKRRQRLTLEEYKAIWRIAPPWLRCAMDLSLETTHAALEICSVRYDHIEWLEEPIDENGVQVFGYLKIHRQKVKKKESSRVMIPVTLSLKKVIDDSKDNIASAYVVHRMPEKISNEVSKYCEHLTQVNRKFLSRKFSHYRDLAGVKKHLDKTERPTFHEVRGLSIHLFDKAGYDPQARAAHSDARSTKVYKEGHEKWVQVPAGEIGIRSPVPK